MISKRSKSPSRYLQAGPYYCCPAFNINGEIVGYYVDFYLVFDGDHFYSFNNHADAVEQTLLIQEYGTYCMMFTKQILVTPTAFSSIFNAIIDNVRSSHLDR